MLWQWRYKNDHKSNIYHGKRNRNDKNFFRRLSDNKREKYIIVYVKQYHGNQEYFQVHEEKKIPENTIVYDQFEENKNTPDNPVINVRGLYLFKK